MNLFGKIIALVCASFALCVAVDFTGTWKLDLGASSIPDAILEAQGLSWVEKQAAKSLSVTQKVTQTATLLTIVIEPSWMGARQDLTLGGPFMEKPGEGGRPPYRIRAYLTNGGEAVAVETVGRNKKGVTLQATLLRTLEDQGKTMRQRIFFKSEDGHTAEGVRVFRRVP